jgi:hypothetical protein
VAIENDRMVITRQQTTTTDLATTQVYKRSGSSWALEFTWTTEAGRFATARVRNDWLVIGEACGSINNTCHGMVRIFKRWSTGWTFLMWIHENTLPQDYGRAVAFDGTNLAVASKSGVYAYVLSDPWFYNHIATYPPPPYSPWGNGGFAFDVAVSGKRIAVSSIGGLRSTPSGTRYNPGLVHIYDTAANGLVQTLTGEGVELTSSFGSGFGYSISMSGTRLAVAAPFESTRRRTVYLFSDGASGYTLTHTLTQPESPGYETAVAIDGGRMLVTTSGSSNVNTLARIYSLGGGIFGPQLAFEASLPSSWAQPAIHGKRAAVGQPLRDSWNRGRVSTWFLKEPVIFPGSLAKSAN